MTSFADSSRLSSAFMMLAFSAAILFSVVRVARTANNEYFFAKPYVQVQPSAPDAPSISWQAADSDADWRVKYTTDGRHWQLAQPALLSRIKTELMTEHRLYRADLSGIGGGKHFRYIVFRNGEQVFSGRGLSPVSR
jgi:hypothetical protein